MALSRYASHETVLVAGDSQIFQHMAGCTPRSYLRGGQRSTLGPFHCCYYPRHNGMGGPLISDGLSRSPVSADYLIPAQLYARGLGV